MKKNLFFRLCLIMSVALFIYACRTDHLPENEIRYNNSNAFQFVELKDIPQVSKFIKNRSGRNDLRLSLRNSAAKSSINQDDINLESSDILKHTTAEGVYYIFNINEIGNDNTIYTLEAKENNGGIVSAKVIEYASDVNLKNNPSNLAYFTGTVSAYSLDGIKYSSLNYSKGNSDCPPPGTGSGSPENPTNPGLPNPGDNPPTFPWNPNYPGGPYSPSPPSTGGSGSSTDPNGNQQPCNPNSYVVISEIPYEDGSTFQMLENECGVIYTQIVPLRDLSSGVSNKTNEDCNEEIGVIVLPHPNTVDPCKKAKASVMATDNLLKEPNISAEVASLENHAANSFTEYGMAIINTGTTTIAQDPYTNNDPSNPGSVSITIPSVGDYIASAHTHPDHGAAPPSAKDFYQDLKDAKNHPTFQAGLVFANNGTKYAFVVNDRAKVEAFLTAYPFSNNTTPDGRMFNENSQVGRDFIEILKNYTEGRLPNYSGNDQNDGLESSYAEILQRYDIGISIAKTDANGNLKSLRSVSFKHTIPASGGKKIIGYKAEECP